MIISLSFFSTYHVVSVFLCILLFLIHTYWLYLSASISLSLSFFLAFTWNSLALHCHPQNPHRPPCNRRDPPLPRRFHFTRTNSSFPWDHSSSTPPPLLGVTFRGLSHPSLHESCRVTEACHHGFTSSRFRHIHFHAFPQDYLPHLSSHFLLLYPG